MTKGRTVVNDGMRPNIDISHSLNGRVKDYAAENDLSTAEAYRDVIEAGLSELEGVDDDE